MTFLAREEDWDQACRAGEQEASFERVRPLIFELLMRPKYPLFLSVFPMSVHPNLHFILLKKEKKGCEPVGKLNLTRKERNKEMPRITDISLFIQKHWGRILSPENSDFFLLCIFLVG